LRKNINDITPEAIAAFSCYEWPGNVRELRNVVERAMILEDDDQITAKYLPRGLTGDSGMRSSGAKATDTFCLPSSGIALDEVEMSLVRQALARSGGNQTKAAELLYISRDQLRYRMKKLEQSESIAASETSQ
jgi:two-component system, NtrC family, response regulator AtoC